MRMSHTAHAAPPASTRRSSATVGLTVACVALLAACSGGESEASSVERPPLVGALELPVSQRTGDALPAGALAVALSASALEVADEALGNLEGGRLPAALSSKLDQALAAHKAAPVALTLHASAPYAAVFSVLSALQGAGTETLVFKVRKASGTEAGYAKLAGFGVTEAAEDAAVAIPGAPVNMWDTFAAAWSDVEGACRASDTGNCAYKPTKVAAGGELKTVLLVAGQGANVHFYRVGGPPVEVEVPAKVDAQDKARGKGQDKTDPMAELEQAPPATQALFQFRAKEALKTPSAIGGTVAAAWGEQAGGVVIAARAATPAMRLIALLGAAFPDGKPAPRIVFAAPK